jgi:hypothetical protein
MATIHGSPVTSARSDPQQQRAILVIIGNLPFVALSPPYIRNGAILCIR